MDLSSVVTSIGTYFLIFVGLMCVFTWLSRMPSYDVIYYPNRILKGMVPWEGSDLGRPRHPLSWIKEALRSTEADIIAMSGVDTAVYFVFLSTVLGILALSTVILLPILLPVAATCKGEPLTSYNETADDIAKLSMAHVEKKSPRLWPFFAAVFWVSFLTYYLLWKAYKHVVNLRASVLTAPDEWINKAKAGHEQFVIIVRDIPAVPQVDKPHHVNGQEQVDQPHHITRQEQVDSFFRKLYPDTFYKSMIITVNRKLNSIWKQLEDCKKKLAKAEALYTKSSKTKPTHRTGFLGLVGNKVDSIEYWKQNIKDLSRKLKSAQTEACTLKENKHGCAIIFFNNTVTAASAAQSLHATMVDTWTVMQAPEPSQIIWENLNLNFYERILRQYTVYAIVALLILFYVIPMGIVSALSTLDNLVHLLPSLKAVEKIPAIRTILEAYLPQLALIVFLAILPYLLMFLSKVEGIPSKSHAIRATSGKYFYFIVLNVFLGGMLDTSLFTMFYRRINPKETVISLASRLPDSATFFLTYVAMKFFIGYGLELSGLIPIVKFHLRKKYLGDSEEDLRKAWAPEDLGYDTRFPGDMLIITIVLCYSVVSPLILPFGAAYFGLGWLVLRNQALKVYVPSFESYGRMWPHMYLRVVGALLLYQVTMLTYFRLKVIHYYGLVLLTLLPIATLVFAFVCHKKFYRFFQFTALEVAAIELKEHANMEQVYRSFIPPCLSSTLDEDEDEDEEAVSPASS